MTDYATYVYYTAEYHGGLIPAADFPAYIRRASALVRQATFRRLDGTAQEDMPEAARLAACAVAETLFRHDAASGSQTASERIGDYSVSYFRDGGGSGDLRRETDRAIRAYLGGSALMGRRAGS